MSEQILTSICFIVLFLAVIADTFTELCFNLTRFSCNSLVQVFFDSVFYRDTIQVVSQRFTVGEVCCNYLKKINQKPNSDLSLVKFTQFRLILLLQSPGILYTTATEDRTELVNERADGNPLGNSPPSNSSMLQLVGLVDFVLGYHVCWLNSVLVGWAVVYVVSWLFVPSVS